MQASEGFSKPLCVLAWNPNGVRSLMRNNPQGVRQLLQIYQPDIVIFDEIKGNEKKQHEMTASVEAVMPGYRWLWNNSHKPGVHGLAIAITSQLQVLGVDFGFGDGVKEPEGRLITLELDKAYVVGLYAVNAGVQGCDRLEYKLEWMLKLHQYLERLRKTGKIVIAMGDFNVAPSDMDVHDPVKLKNCAGFTPEERHTFKFIQSQGWLDVFRTLYPHKVAYTYFSHTSEAGRRFGGWRIDHALVNLEAFEKVKFQCEILPEYLGSDHCPVVLKVEFPQEDISNGFRWPTLVRIKVEADGKPSAHDIYIGGKRQKHGWNLERSIWKLPKSLILKDAQQTLKGYEMHLRRKIKEQPDVYLSAFKAMLRTDRRVMLGCRCASFEKCHGNVIIKLLKELVQSKII